MRSPCACAAVLILITLPTSGCSELTGVNETVFSFDFADNAQGWTGDFSDYPPEQREEVGFVWDHRSLPSPLHHKGGALYQYGNNLSDDLFMFFKRRVEGLQPERTYRIRYSITIASSIAHGCDAGPGPMTYVKIGGSSVEPLPDAIDRHGWVRMNIDIGSQKNDGANAVWIGDIRNRRSDCFDYTYGLKTIKSEKTVDVQADTFGRLWLLVGTDSAWESPYHVYFSEIEARLEPR